MSKQTDKLLAALQRRPMTAGEIWHELGIARASARVFDLRREGYDVRSTDVVVRNRDGEDCHVAQYSLVSAQRRLLPVAPGRGALAA